jgi:hypothetical protein
MNMDILTIGALALAAIGTVLGILAHAAVVRRNRALLQRLELLETQQSLQGQSLAGFATGTQGVDERLARLEARERVLSERQDVLESEQADERPYNHAIRLVQQGAGIRRLTEELGLSESEADLIVRLHGEPEPPRAATV